MAKSDQDKWQEEYKKARSMGSSTSNARARANGAVYESELSNMHKRAKEAESMTQAQREAQARKSMTKSENENIDKIRALMKRERDLRQAQQGRYEGDTGDMNTGKSSGDVYTHSRKR